MYVSGCLGLDKDTGKIVTGGAAAEAKQALVNLKNVLTAAGSSIQNVVKATIFVKDLNQFSVVNEEYQRGTVHFVFVRIILSQWKVKVGSRFELDQNIY